MFQRVKCLMNKLTRLILKTPHLNNVIIGIRNEVRRTAGNSDVITHSLFLLNMHHDTMMIAANT